MSKRTTRPLSPASIRKLRILAGIDRPVDDSRLCDTLWEEMRALRTVRAERDELLAALQPVAWLYENEQTRGEFPAGRTWLTIPHDIGQRARAAVTLALRRRAVLAPYHPVPESELGLYDSAGFPRR